MTPRPLLLAGGGGLAREVLATVRLLPDEWKTMERWMTTRASTVPILTACLFSAVPSDEDTWITDLWNLSLPSKHFFSNSILTLQTDGLALLCYRSRCRLQNLDYPQAHNSIGNGRRTAANACYEMIRLRL
jgi:hypothetical protein